VLRTVSHLRKVNDPVAEIARAEVEARSPPRELSPGLPGSETRLQSSWKDLTLINCLSRWEKTIARFADEFQEIEEVLGPDSFLHLMAGFEKKEKRFRTAMAQLRREKCDGRALEFNVKRDSDVFAQVCACLENYAKTASTKPAKRGAPLLAVQKLVARFEGEIGEGSALLRSVMAGVAHTLRNDGKLFSCEDNVEGPALQSSSSGGQEDNAESATVQEQPPSASAQEQMRHFGANAEAHSDADIAQFRNVGRLLGLGLLFDCRLPIFFYRHTYKFILGRSVSLADLAYYKNDTYRSMTNLMDMIAEDPEFDISSMSLEFKAEWTPDGIPIPVSRNNWAAYLKHFARGEMIGNVARQLEAMQQGLLEVVPQSCLLGLTAEDLQLLLAGKSGRVSVEMLRGVLRFVDDRTAEGREGDSNTMADFEEAVWGALKDFNDDERLALIAFATGTPVLPDEMAFHLQDAPSSSAEGPFARQCENYIQIPSYEVMDAAMLAEVLKNASRTTVRYDTI